MNNQRPNKNNEHHQQQQQQAQQQQESEARRAIFLQHLAEFVQKASIHIQFPATVKKSSSNNNNSTTSSSPSPLRTDVEFINLKLLDSGIQFEDDFEDVNNIQENKKLSYTVEDAALHATGFISSLKESDCYNNVQVLFDSVSSSTPESNKSKKSKKKDIQLKVLLDEKKWYKLYIGGGVKHESASNFSMDLPKMQFESSLSLLNLMGVTDITSMSYNLDQTNCSSLYFNRDQPLFTIFPKYSTFYNLFASKSDGTKINFNANASIYTQDQEWTSSYQQFNRDLKFTMSNRRGQNPDMMNGIYKSLSYCMSLRDLMPRRHSNGLPFAIDASPQILQYAGPNVKSSLSFIYKTNGEYLDSKLNPTNGIDYFYNMEIANVFGGGSRCTSTLAPFHTKLEGGVSLHLPITGNNGIISSPKKNNKNNDNDGGISLHLGLFGGFLKPLFSSSSGNNNNNNHHHVSDRFHLGGPLQLRGFQPSGIGPRSPLGQGGKSTYGGGDSLGGDMYYVANLSLSIPSPYQPFGGSTSSEEEGEGNPNSLRFFGFWNMGTLINTSSSSSSSSSTSSLLLPISSNTASALVKSTRISVGAGACMATPMGRLEATYAIPLRYGPRDARKSAQFGLGFTFQ